MPKSKKPKPASVDAYMEFKAVFKDWLIGERDTAYRLSTQAREKLDKIRPDVLAAMRRLNLKAQDVFTRQDVDDETLALLEQYTTLNLERDMAVERMVAVDRTREGNYGPAFEAFLQCDQHHQFLHLDMVKEMFT